ncbi:MAG: MFS transporter [Solirubrobacteraceae bacterium]|nr:MFS transporter [Solirubrobacteraceae bacterium]
MARIAVDLTALRRSRDLRLLTIGQACSSLGTQAALVALPYQVYVETDSPLLVGLIGAVELVPNVLGSLLGGAWADRVDRRRLMLAAQAVLTLVAVLLVVLSALGAAHVAALFVLAAALAASGAVVNVTRAAAVPALSGPYLRSALAINFSVAQLASIVGPGGGGLLISLAGVEAVYLLDAVAFALVLALAVPIRPLPPTDADAEHPPIARSIAEGLRFVAANRALLGSFVIDLAAMTFAMPRALFPVLALTVYDAGASGTGLLYASVSAGAVLAAVTTGWLERARWLGRITIVSVVVWGAAIALVGIAPSLWWAAALLALAGAADSVSAVCRSVINQVVTPEHLRGRMSSVFMLVVTSGPRLGDLRSGLAGSLLPVTAAVASGGLLCLAAVAVIAVAFPQLARYDSEREEARLRAAA